MLEIPNKRVQYMLLYLCTELDVSLYTGQWVEERVTRKCSPVDSSTTGEDKPLVEARTHVCCKGRY